MNAFTHLEVLGFAHVLPLVPAPLLTLLEADETLCLARVSREDRGAYSLLTRDSATSPLLTLRAHLGGSLRYKVTSREELPAVGDWVVARRLDDHEAMIWQLVPRHNRLLRQAAGDKVDAQVIAANLDVLFIVSSMNQEFEPRRLERYLLAAQEAHCQPVIVLNKADLATDPAAYVARALAIAADAPVVSSSSLEGDLSALAPWLKEGSTCALVGSSGVGKSTITNRLLRAELQATQHIREDDGEGRHTTTARHLMVLPEGQGVLIDTPGMRELQLWAGDQALDTLFDDVAALAERCRFRDCLHVDEPGCAVLEAVEEGELTPGRLESWRKLGRELAWQARRQDVAAQRAEYRRFAKMVRAANHKKPRNT